MQNQYIFAMVPVVALLAGCPVGPGDGLGEGEGEGEVGEGEGEGEPFAATLDMTFPNDVSGVIVNGETDECLDQPAHTYVLTEPGSYEVQPTPTDPNRRCVAQGVDVEESGSYQMNWNGTGKCGLAPNGEFKDSLQNPVTVTTTFDGQDVTLRFSFRSYDMLVTGNACHGEHTGPGGNQFVTDCSISEDLCQIDWSETKDGIDNGQDTLLSDACQ